jgi:hypothetical protein
VKVATRKKFEIGNFKLAFTDAKSRGHIPHSTPPTSITSSPRTPELPQFPYYSSSTMVLQDLGRRINAAVQDLTRSPNLDEKVRDYNSSQDAG